MYLALDFEPEFENHRTLWLKQTVVLIMEVLYSQAELFNDENVTRMDRCSSLDLIDCPYVMRCNAFTGRRLDSSPMGDNINPGTVHQTEPIHFKTVFTWEAPTLCGKSTQPKPSASDWAYVTCPRCLEARTKQKPLGIAPKRL